MRPLKRLFFILTFSFAASIASGQGLYDIHVGLYSTFLSSDSLQSVPGIGLEIGARSQAKISPRFDFYTTCSIYGASFGVVGYKYSVDANFNPSMVRFTSNFIKLGLNYSAGVDFFIVPDKFSVGLGPAIALNYYIAENVEDPLGAIRIDPITKVPEPLATAASLEQFNFDYGARLNFIYRLPKVQFSLEYFHGFSSLTSTYNTSATDIMLGLHFNLKEISHAKPYQNKLIK